MIEIETDLYDIFESFSDEKYVFMYDDVPEMDIYFIELCEKIYFEIVNCCDVKVKLFLPKNYEKRGLYFQIQLISKKWSPKYYFDNREESIEQIYKIVLEFLTNECDLESILNLTDDEYFELQVKYDI
jgi:hypothetical protein